MNTRLDDNRGSRREVLRSGPVRILVVEDDDDLRQILVETLKNSGIEVLSATNGLAAWKILGGFQADLVVMDLNLPGLSGNHLCRRLMQNPRTADVKVVAYSGSGSELVISAFSGCPADANVTKSDSERKLTETTQGLLGLQDGSFVSR